MRVAMLQILECSPAFSSLFPNTEAKLNEIDYQKALKYLVPKKRMDNYHSVLDFLLCESFPEWKLHCQAYYNDNGPKLKDHPDYTDELGVLYDTIMCDVLLELCIAELTNKRRQSWYNVTKTFRSLMAAA